MKPLPSQSEQSHPLKYGVCAAAMRRAYNQRCSPVQPWPLHLMSTPQKPMTQGHRPHCKTKCAAHPVPLPLWDRHAARRWYLDGHHAPENLHATRYHKTEAPCHIHLSTPPLPPLPPHWMPNSPMQNSSLSLSSNTNYQPALAPYFCPCCHQVKQGRGQWQWEWICCNGWCWQTFVLYLVAVVCLELKRLMVVCSLVAVLIPMCVKCTGHLLYGIKLMTVYVIRSYSVTVYAFKTSVHFLNQLG
jgi:hypothetical protein